MPECADCGSHVTAAFVRVFGIDGEVDGCLDCTVSHERTGGLIGEETR